MKFCASAFFLSVFLTLMVLPAMAEEITSANNPLSTSPAATEQVPMERMNERVANTTDQVTGQAGGSDAQYLALQQKYRMELRQNEQAQRDYQNQKDAYDRATQAVAPAQERVTVNAPTAFKPFDMKQCPDGNNSRCQMATCVPYPTRDGVINICQGHGNSFP